MRALTRVALAMIPLAIVACDSDGPASPDAGPPPGVLGPSPIGAPIPIGVELVASGFVSPIAVTSADDGTGRIFVVDQVGTIRVITSAGQLLSTPFLDVRAKLVALRTGFDERGLLGLAFHPNYEQNGRFVVFYSAPPRASAPAGYDNTVRIAEYRVSSDPNVADPASERVILEVDKPQFNHNGGTVLFGPDGYLYISIGDGGNANDVGTGHVEDWFADNAGGNGQDIEQNLLGSILRIDVDRGTPYTIPADNPFVGRRGLDEIWAYGLRNPYRMSFDREGARRLFVGDAGQGLWEEVSIVIRGGNYGWNVREGTHCFDAENNTVVPATCPTSESDGTLLRSPIVEYANAGQAGGLGVTVIGGHVYRGTGVTALQGMYVFGDFSRRFTPPDGSLFAADPRTGQLWPMHELTVQNRSGGRLGHYVKGFGVDDGGEVYVAVSDALGPSGSTGRVYRLVPAA